MPVKARESLSSIIESISLIQEMNTQIATAAEQQNVVANEINQSVNEVSDLANVTFQETDKSIVGLAKIASDLEYMTNHFEL